MPTVARCYYVHRQRCAPPENRHAAPQRRFLRAASILSADAAHVRRRAAMRLPSNASTEQAR